MDPALEPPSPGTPGKNAFPQVRGRLCVWSNHLRVEGVNAEVDSPSTGSSSTSCVHSRLSLLFCGVCGLSLRGCERRGLAGEGEPDSGLSVVVEAVDEVPWLGFGEGEARTCYTSCTATGGGHLDNKFS